MQIQDLNNNMDTFDFKATDLMLYQQNIGNRRMNDFNTTSIKQVLAICRIACQSANDLQSFGRLVIYTNGHPLVSKEITNCNSKYNNGILQLGGFLSNTIVIDSIPCGPTIEVKCSAMLSNSNHMSNCDYPIGREAKSKGGLCQPLKDVFAESIINLHPSNFSDCPITIISPTSTFIATPFILNSPNVQQDSDKTFITLIEILIIGFVTFCVSLLLIHVITKCIIKIHRKPRTSYVYTYGYDLDGYETNV